MKLKNIQYKSGLVLFLAVLLLSSFAFKSKVTISGKLFNTGDEKYIYIFEYLGSTLIKLDSTLNKKGFFQFKFPKPLPRGFYRIGLDAQKSVLVIAGLETFTLEADLNDLSSVSIENSKENQSYQSFRKFNEQISKEYQEINVEAEDAQKKYASQAVEYNKIITGLQERVDSLNKARIDFYAKTIDENKGLFMGKFAQMFSNAGASKETFFSEADFSDPELARGDMLSSKIAIYMQKFVAQDADSWKQASDLLLDKCRVNNINKEVFYKAIIQNMANIDLDYARAVAKHYQADFPSSIFAKELLDAMPKAAPAVGDIAPDIKLKTPDGKEISLASLRGKVVLLDFWASWCGPCRRENPNVVRAYQEYKDKGFTVYSVSLDTEKERWIKAIAADKLEWGNHVSDLLGWQSSAAKLYGIRSIPSAFLLDKKGVVVAVNLRGEALHQMLAQLLQ